MIFLQKNRDLKKLFPLNYEEIPKIVQQKLRYYYYVYVAFFPTNLVFG